MKKTTRILALVCALSVLFGIFAFSVGALACKTPTGSLSAQQWCNHHYEQWAKDNYYCPRCGMQIWVSCAGVVHVK